MRAGRHCGNGRGERREVWGKRRGSRSDGVAQWQSDGVAEWQSGRTSPEVPARQKDGGLKMTPSLIGGGLRVVCAGNRADNDRRRRTPHNGRSAYAKQRWTEGMTISGRPADVQIILPVHRLFWYGAASRAGTVA